MPVTVKDFKNLNLVNLSSALKLKYCEQKILQFPIVKPSTSTYYITYCCIDFNTINGKDQPLCSYKKVK